VTKAKKKKEEKQRHFTVGGKARAAMQFGGRSSLAAAHARGRRGAGEVKRARQGLYVGF
jgi:hypothetical protein